MVLFDRGSFVLLSYVWQIREWEFKKIQKLFQVGKSESSGNLKLVNFKFQSRVDSVIIKLFFHMNTFSIEWTVFFFLIFSSRQCGPLGQNRHLIMLLFDSYPLNVLGSNWTQWESCRGRSKRANETLHRSVASRFFCWKIHFFSKMAVFHTVSV